jgi:hypothetical protein
MLVFLLAAAPAATAAATCDAKPFTLGTTPKPAPKAEPKSAPKLAQAAPAKPAPAAAHKPATAGIAPCKDPKSK